MKKLLALVLVLICLLAVASAEDLSALSLDELTAKRQALIEELTQVNAVRGNLIRQQMEEGVETDESLGRIIDLFPDENFAIVIRESCAKFSIEQTVTQADLDKIKIVQERITKIHDLTGIGLLRNMRLLSLDSNYDGPFPEEIRNCLALDTIWLVNNPNITEVPEWIGELVNLQVLDLYRNSISKLPDSICTLPKLEELDVSNNPSLATLPQDIGNCSTLKRLYISYTAISELPSSLYNLELTVLKMEGTSIK